MATKIQLKIPQKLDIHPRREIAAYVLDTAGKKAVSISKRCEELLQLGMREEIEESGEQKK